MSRRNTRRKQPVKISTDTSNVEISLQAIETELQKLSQHRIVTIYNSFFKQFTLQFFRGIFFGLGTAMGATIVLSGLLYVLAQIEFVPIIGEWVKMIILQLNGESTPEL
ncbi:MAG: hypothetical protein HRU38_09995 [Saccharospirillaceae bacterium]|nr:DUF5665 domain-containing protein [Pseudomonadales bacterium]NRB78984.1 hypothetical protein [Saccharospirillaceae bacterium]